MKIFFCLVTVLLTAGCNYNHVKDTAKSGGNIDLQALQEPDFQKVSSLVLETKCSGCHSDKKGRSEKGVSFDHNFDQVRKWLPRIIDRALDRMDMPQDAPLSGPEQALLRKWYDDGAVDTVSGPGEKPDPNLEKGPTDFAKIRDKIFANKCTACHQGADAAKGLDLTNIDMVREKAALIIQRTTIDQDMPPPPLPILTEREWRVLSHWFRLRMPL